jgi:hypothetical protein
MFGPMGSFIRGVSRMGDWRGMGCGSRGKMITVRRIGIIGKRGKGVINGGMGKF